MRRRAVLLCVLLVLPGCAGRSSRPPAAPGVLTAASAAPAYEDVTAGAGIKFTATSSPTPYKYLVETMGSGCAFIDYDNDGFQDILLLNGAPLAGARVGSPTPRLYHNNRNGTFTDVTQSSGLAHTMYAMGCAVGDYDNDGFDDIYISCVLGPGHLYHNDGHGQFRDVTQKAGVGNSGMWGTSCAWVDADNDGKLDLFVCNYLKYRSLADDVPCYSGGRRIYCTPGAYSPTHCVLFHNDGNGRFTDISARSGIAAAAGKSLGVAIWDYDHDGRPDIYVANDTTPGFLFHNLGGRFEELGTVSGISVDDQGGSHNGMGIDVGDPWNNGSSAMVMTNFSGSQFSLYRETSPGLYADARLPTGFGPATSNYLGFGALFLDYDNDGRGDIFTVNGHVQDDISRDHPGVTYAETPLLFHNEPDGSYRDVSAQVGGPFTRPIVGRGVAAGDFDNDGRIDLLVTTNNGPAALWHNVTSGGSAITIKLRGVKSNRDGIGAVLTASSPGLTQTAMMKSGSSYLSASELRAHFGLGVNRTASLRVRWPSGVVDNIAHVAAGAFCTVVEGSGVCR